MPKKFTITKRVMNNKKLELSEIQEKEFSMLCKLHDFCVENNLRYFLCGGTLLGAIRHQDFIPWDDDIDVVMPRADYIRLIQLNETQKAFPLVTITNGSANIPHGKILDLKTEIIQKDYKLNNISHLWVDIFPMDGLPESNRSLAACYKTSLFLRKMLLATDSRLGHGSNILKIVGKILALPFLSLIGGKRIALLMDWFCQRIDFESSKYVGGLCWGYGPQERMIKDDFLPGTTALFHGKEFFVPCCWDKYLTNLYGNYMQLPPLENRKCHEMIVYES